MKNTFKVLAVSSLLALFATSANAQWNMSAGYTQLSDDSDGLDVTLGAVTVGAGYLIENDESQFSWMPEIKIGLGIKDDSFFGIDVEIDRYVALSFRGQYQVNDTIYVYAQPVYANLKISAPDYGESSSEWELGFGGGVGFQATEALSFEATYESIDGTDVASVGIRYKF